MKTKSISKIKAFLILVCAACMVLCFAAFTNVNRGLNARAEGEQIAEISGVQVRSLGAYDTAEPTAGYNFIVLLSGIYDTTPTDKVDIATLNTRSKIRIYTSASDTEGRLLSDNNLIGGWYEYEQFGQKGLFMAYNTPSDYGIYNGSTIYKIVVEEGCQLPYGTNSYYTISETVTYYNLEYGVEGAANGAFKWSKTRVDYSDELVDVTGVQVRSLGAYEDSESNIKDYNFIVLQNVMYKFGVKDGAAVERDLGVVEINNYLNTTSKIKVYKSADGETDALCVNIDSSEADDSTAENRKYKYDGPHTYCVEVMAGCQFPTSQNGKFGYVTTATAKKFYNKEYGMTGAITGETDIDGTR